MRSSIGFLFCDSRDKKSMFPLNKDISETELRSLLDIDKKSSSLCPTKVDTRPQNKPLTNKELGESYHDQRNVPTGVRRFAEPSEGDSIFNNDADIVRDRIEAHRMVKQREKSQDALLEFDNPVERIKKAMNRDHLRMT